MKCCPECTCDERVIACYSMTGPPPPKAVGDHETIDAQPEFRLAPTLAEATPVVTEGWQMTGLASGRKSLGHRRRDVPILCPIDGGVEWVGKELHGGIRPIEVCVDAEDPADAYVKVLGVEAKDVYATWQRIAEMVVRGDWLRSEPF